MTYSEKGLKTARFGCFVFDQEAGLLKRRGRSVHLRPLAVRMLSILVQNAGSLVTRKQLREALWGDRVVEWEMGLHRLARELRTALGDDARNPRFIQTVTRRGYRFCRRVEYGVERHPKPSMMHRGRWFLAGLLTFPTLILAVCLYQALAATMP